MTVEQILKKFIAELRRSRRASGALWVRNFGKSIDARNFGYDFSVHPPARPYKLSGSRWGGMTPSGEGVFMQVSLAGNRMASVAFGKGAFLAGNDIDCHRFFCSIKASLAKLFALF